MKDRTALRERYLRDELPVRLGGLAANLARVKSFSDHPGHQKVVEHLLEESKFFIEWTIRDADLEIQAELVELQRQLARWQRHWQRIWSDLAQREAVAEQAGRSSRQVLKMAGLVN
ncbi:MAG: hypothetical protein HYW07_19030 [Candidatus Latescibacteria bacterium]|nr:hypothetical protein [Candidatus Latescibacterota bacterium]